MSKKHCVINFAKNAWYPTGQKRLVESLKTVGFDGDILTFDDETQIGAPTHQQSPYAFKPFALRHAVELGYRYVLWADASVWAIKPIQPMFDIIEKQGHMFFHNASFGEFASDASLKTFGLTREESFNTKGLDMLQGICMGWDMHVSGGKAFLDQWLAMATDGVTFPGAWVNKNGQVSSDPRVHGHRHDQTAASFLAWKLGMKLIIAHETVFQYYENPTKNLFSLNPDMSMINPGIVMVAQGL